MAMSNPYCTPTIARPQLPPLDLRGGSFRRLVNLLALWAERRRQRHHLARLDERMLKDVGLSRADIWIEVEKPFWRA
jgi:uncharacterized protein YjiS (DUF1127 family)